MSDSNWTPLPPGSHLSVLNEDGKTWKVGARAVALRTTGWDEHGQVMTAAGYLIGLSEDCHLIIGMEGIE